MAKAGMRSPPQVTVNPATPTQHPANNADHVRPPPRAENEIAAVAAIKSSGSGDGTAAIRTNPGAVKANNTAAHATPRGTSSRLPRDTSNPAAPASIVADSS
jgi:hypothetical protein